MTQNYHTTQLTTNYINNRTRDNDISFNSDVNFINEGGHIDSLRKKD